MDGSDPAWREARKGFLPGEGEDDAALRYRDWGLLKYWFRAAEAFAPWVRTIHFVTWGHLPPWLDTTHPKLHIVRHEAYLPAEGLPTFSSNAIELGMHRMEGLAEQFVYFNDDMFLLRPVAPETFFRGGLPCDSAVMSPTMAVWGEWIGKTVLNNVFVINKHFDKRSVVRARPLQWLNLRYGSQLLRTLCLLPWRHFPGFYNDHLPVAYLRSTFVRVWEQEEPLLRATEARRFRNYDQDVNHWLMRYWQLCEGRFVPVGARGKDLPMDAPETYESIRKQRYAMICLNDSQRAGEAFQSVQKALDDAFASILPSRSSFEKDH